MPFVSVIIPVHNTEKFLRRCLESVCGQTLEEIEIICIDDCSTDASAAIIAEFATRDSRVKVITFERNRGTAVARNAGIDAATGDYLGFVDSDDAVDLDFYEKLYAQAIATGADVVKGNVRTIGYDGNVQSSLCHNDLIRKCRTRFAFAWCFWTAIYRAKVVRDNKLNFCEGCILGQDVLFLNAIMLCSKGLAFVDDVHYHYFQREDSACSRILTLSKLRCGFRVYNEIIDRTLSAGDVVDSAGRRFICASFLRGALEYAYRVKMQSELRYCLATAFGMYDKVRALVTAESLMPASAALPYLQRGDRDGLFVLMLKNDTPRKMMFASIRYLQEQRKRQSQRGE